MPEVDRLLQGHRTVGNWSLGQICNHLAGSFIYSVEGFPAQGPLADSQDDRPAGETRRFSGRGG